MQWTKIKVLTENEVNVCEVMISLSDRLENIVGKGENAGYQFFSFFLRVISWLHQSFVLAEKNILSMDSVDQRSDSTECAV